MDSRSIITSVTQDDELLTRFPPEAALKHKLVKKPRHKGFLNTLLCCFRANPGSSNATVHTEENGQYSPKLQGKYLLPQAKHSDTNKICMVIDLDETLVHSSFKPIDNPDFIVPVEIEGTIHQVYVLKRPHVDEFLQRMGELYECVLFTASLAKYADPLANLLDKWDAFRARLFRESCVFYKGNYVKDLSKLGRDLQRVVIVDNSPASYVFHPDNAVPVASWFDDMSDTELLDLIPFLENLSKADTVQSVLRHANNFLNQQQQLHQEHQHLQTAAQHQQQQQQQQIHHTATQSNQSTLQLLPSSTPAIAAATTTTHLYEYINGSTASS